jgi:hypothetical protein
MTSDATKQLTSGGLNNGKPIFYHDSFIGGLFPLVNNNGNNHF